MAAAENSDHTEEDINPDVAFPPLPPLSDSKDEKNIQPNVKKTVIGNVLDSDENPNEDATNENKNVNNSIPDDGKMENNYGGIFHLSNPSPSEKCAWTSPRIKILKYRRLSYRHLHRFEDEFTNVTQHALKQYTIKVGPTRRSSDLGYSVQ